MDLKLNINQVQQLNLTTELIQAIEILELNTVELEEFLMKESEENVLIDYEIKNEDRKNILKSMSEDKKTFYESPQEEEDSFEKYVSADILLIDILKEQLRDLNLNENENSIGLYLIESIDDDGYLRTNLNEIAENLKVSVHEVFYILKKIWTFDPKGVGARDLRECLLLQISDEDIILKKIVEDHLEDISKNKINTIAKSMKISINKVMENVEKIKKLNPKPGASYFTAQNSVEYIYPEAIVKEEKGNLEVSINESDGFNVFINEYYLNLLDSDIDEDTREFLNKKLSRTMFLMKSINQRRENIEKVVNSIVNRQKNFFLKGSPVEPMILSDIAKELDISESTVSRVTKNKYIECSRGIYPFKYFFSGSISAASGNVSRNYIEKMIIDLIEKENKSKPLSDQKITDLILKEGISINRRTIAKYRDELNILPANLRRRFDEL